MTGRIRAFFLAAAVSGLGFTTVVRAATDGCRVQVELDSQTSALAEFGPEGSTFQLTQVTLTRSDDDGGMLVVTRKQPSGNRLADGKLSLGTGAPYFQAGFTAPEWPDLNSGSSFDEIHYRGETVYLGDLSSLKGDHSPGEQIPLTHIGFDGRSDLSGSISGECLR